MRAVFTLLASFIFISSFCQVHTKQIPVPQWEFSVGSGPYLDLFYANIIIGGDDSTPPSYPNKKGKRVNVGKLDRIEMKYLFNSKSAISLYFQNAQYKDMLGSGNDPLGVWTDLKRNNRRMHFTLNYYRMFPSGKRGSWSIASGFQVQIEKN